MSKEAVKPAKAKAPAKTGLDALMSQISKSTDSSSLEDSKYSKIEYFIDTGDYALNKIISGDFYNGIPSGKLTILAGESSSGKSFIAANCMANALKQNNVDRVFLFDSEGGSLIELMKALGADMSKIQHILVSSIEDATLKMGKTIKSLREYMETKDGANCRFFIVLDSIGNLLSDKVFDDIEKDKVATDMGQRAKQVKILTGSIMNESIKSGIPVLMINHVMDNPATSHPGKVKSMGGGKSLVFNAHVLIQCSRTLTKDETKNEDLLKSYYSASVLNFFTAKNRLVRPFLSSSSFLHFQNGIHKYFGLFDLALQHGFVVKHSNVAYSCPSVHGEATFKQGTLIGDTAMWTAIMPELNRITKEALTYGNGSANGEMDIEEECDDLLS